MTNEPKSPDPSRARVEGHPSPSRGMDDSATPDDERPDGPESPPEEANVAGPEAGPVRRIVLLGRNLVVVFGASEYVAPIRLRLFHVGGRRFSGMAYRVAPNPDGGTTWTPDAFREADLLEAAEHIASLRIVGAGCPATLEVGDSDLAMLAATARPPQRFAGSWRRRGVRLPLRPPAAEEA